MASPASAALIAGIVWVGDYLGLQDGTTILYLTFPLTLVAGILMVSNIRYHSFKQFDLKNRVPFVWVLAIVMIFALIASEPPLVLFSMAAIYALSGPILTLMIIRQRRAKRKRQDRAKPKPVETE